MGKSNRILDLGIKEAWSLKTSGFLIAPATTPILFDPIRKIQTVIKTSLKQYNHISRDQALNMRPPVTKTL